MLVLAFYAFKVLFINKSVSRLFIAKRKAEEQLMIRKLGYNSLCSFFNEIEITIYGFFGS